MPANALPDEQAHVESTLREREMGVERSINFVRAGVFAFGAAADVVSALTQGIVSAAYVRLIVAVVLFCVCYLAAVHVLASGRTYHRWLTYLTITVDCALPAVLLIEMTRTEFSARIGIDSVLAVSALVIAIIVALNALRLRPFAAVYAALLGAAVISAASWKLPAAPLLRIWLAPLVLVSGAVTWWVSRNVRFIIQALRRREKLARFLPRELVAMLESSDLDATLGGKVSPVTVLFADIRGFTRYCEDRAPEEVVEVLNEYFTVMTAAIRAHGGMIDKYVGDAVMAVFGAPLPRDDHAERAVDAAREMLRQLALLNARWAEAGRPPFQVGIALHSGPAMAGTIGAPDRMDYTVIGDTVNLTARLEEMNKTYHTTLILSEDTMERTSAAADCRLLGEVEVRGRHAPVRVYAMATAPVPPSP